MRKKIYLSILSIGLMLTMCSNTLHDNSNDKPKQETVEETKKVNEVKKWDCLIKAIIKIESEGKLNAISKDGSSCGIMQITPICVKDCNRIIKMKKYTLQDRFNKEKSFEMFEIIQKYYNPNRDIEKAIRIWNGGCGYSVNKTQPYYNKVNKEYQRLLKGVI